MKIKKNILDVLCKGLINKVSNMSGQAACSFLFIGEAEMPKELIALELSKEN